jgi:hypothetical protein
MGIAFHRKKQKWIPASGFGVMYERYKKRKYTSVYGRTALMG